MELDEFGFSDIRLMEGERIDSALTLRDGGGRGPAGGPEVMLLTDKRIIHLHGTGKRQKAIFVSIQDVDTVEVSTQREGNGSFIWAALAFVVAILIYYAVDHSVGRIAAAGIVALMGVYLIADRLLDPGKPLVILKARSTQFWCSLNDSTTRGDVYPFINRLFHLKSANGSDGLSRADHLAPR